MKEMANKQRLFQKMKEEQIDGVITFKPENFFYVTGYKPHMGGEITIAPRHATNMAVVPINEFENATMIINSWEQVPATDSTDINDIRTFPVWIEIFELDDFLNKKTKRTNKHVQYDIEKNIQLLGEAIREKGLDTGRLGIELDFISANAFGYLQKELPSATFVDSSRMFHDVQVVLTPNEVEIIKVATQMAERGMLAVAESKLQGKTVDEIKMIYQQSVMNEAFANPALGYQANKVTMSIGGDFAPKTGSSPYRAAKGDIIFFDPGVKLKGYHSDIGRSMVIGKPNDFQKKIMSALQKGIEKMYEEIKPGVPVSKIFTVGQDTIRSEGIESYTRGHLGHAVGLGKGERPPFISEQDKTILEEGMVFCIETPLYIHGAGGFQIEDTLVITNDGFELFTDLPRSFLEVE